MDLLQALQERRSIYNFKRDPVDKLTLSTIFTYASWAPTHYMKEPWRIHVYQGEGRKAFVHAIIASYERSGMIKRDQKGEKMKASMTDFLLAIPHHALIYFPIDADPIRYEEDYAAVSAFIQNAQLAAWTFDVGMLWTITPYMHDPAFYKDIGLDEQMKIAAVMQIGYPQKIPNSKPRTPIEDKLTFMT
ncbi:nitroreductase family protein [Lentibacillus saliphilus]|uniref:nitroreductase family protein n=1 Tax=Lentibacillus saliphilus TaxID=2737028 RepID=UPI001C2F1434|nr:nitroreductase [Lentibacillus saliphilus]